MKKIILLLIFVIIVIFVFLNFVFLKREGPSLILNESYCEKFFDERLEKICEAILKENVSTCREVKDFEDICYEIAISSINLTLDECEKIENNYGKFLCYNKLARETKNITLCLGYDECILEIAKLTKNEETCNYFKNDELFYQTCLYVVKEDRKYCYNLANNEIKECLSHMPKNIEDCKINDEFSEDCVMRIAKNTRDEKICELIKREYTKMDCKLTISKDENICNNYTVGKRDICLLFFLKNMVKKNE